MAGRSLSASRIFKMLKEDHAQVKGLFGKCRTAEGRERREIAKTVIQELEIHADLEEKLIYPAIRSAIENKDMMNAAVEKHHLVHVLIAELKMLKPDDEKFQAKFTVLGELVAHHIEEEEGEILPQAVKSTVDWESLETRVMKRKEVLSATILGRGNRSGLTRRSMR